MNQSASSRVVKKPSQMARSPRNGKDVSQLTSNLKMFDKSGTKKRHNFISGNQGQSKSKVTEPLGTEKTESETKSKSGSADSIGEKVVDSSC